MNTLRFPASSLEELRAGMLTHAPNEGAAILVAERVELGNRTDFLLRDVIHAPAEHVRATQFTVEIAPEFIARVMKQARLDELSLFFAHSHPFARTAEFSAVDDAGESRLLPTVFQRIPKGPHGALVMTPTDCLARVYTSPASAPEQLRVVEVGSSLRAWPAFAPSTTLDERSDRTVRALGEDAQRILANLRVGIVGVGGMGSLIVQQLAHLGVRDFVLIDPDPVEATNLNRLVGATSSSVGKPKVVVAEKLVHELQRDAIVDAVVGDVRFERDARRLLALDIVVSCTDSHGSRAVMNQLGQQYFVPIIDTGVRIDAPDGRITAVVGRTQLLAPGLPCLICDALLDPEQVRRDLLTDEERRRDPYIVGVREVQPAVISINGTVASLAVTMLLAFACGFPLASRHQIYMADKGVVRAVAGSKNEHCYVCSAAGAFGRGDRWSMPWRRA